MFYADVKNSAQPFFVLYRVTQFYTTHGNTSELCKESSQHVNVIEYSKPAHLHTNSSHRSHKNIQNRSDSIHIYNKTYITKTK